VGIRPSLSPPLLTPSIIVSPQVGKFAFIVGVAKPEPVPEEKHEWFQSRKGGPKKQGKGTHNRKRHLYWNSHTGEIDPIPEELQVREEERIPGGAERSETGEGAGLAPHT